MLKFSSLLRTGKSGARKSPEAAKCWAGQPEKYQSIISCVEVTEFRNAQARTSCVELVLMGRPASLRHADGASLARLCLANRTYALLVPGAPPSARDLRRVREYARVGIEWVITGDVYNGDYERFRDGFNSTIIAKVEAERGPGYFERLAKKIDGSSTSEYR